MLSFNLAELLDMPKLPDHMQKVNKALEKSLAGVDPTIAKPALRHVQAPSKRLRPALLLASATSGDKLINKQVITACVAVELAHIASLIHDDIIDHAASRRGIPTISVQEGSDQAIIIGDYLLSLACAKAAQINAQAAELLATTITDICVGQSLEVADQYNVDRNGGTMLSSIRQKTATLFAATCKMGGLCANLDSTQLEALSSYGENLGMAFQLLDDVLDFVSTEKLLGKPIGNDVAEGVYTMPILLVLNSPVKEKIRQQLQTKIPASPALVRLLIEQRAIGKTILVAREYGDKATLALQSLGAKQPASLAEFPNTYLLWCLNNLVNPNYQADLAASLRS